MPKAGRVGVDKAGGVITGPGSPNVFTNNKKASVLKDIVATHGDSPHVQPPIVSGSKSVFINNKPATVQTISKAACGHPVSTGSPNVYIGR
jgi:uncharacterized Zn-binding protein involved in type VI secretion